MIVNIYRERKNQLFDAFSRKLMIKTDQNRSTFTPANRPTHVLASGISKTLHRMKKHTFFPPDF